MARDLYGMSDRLATLGGATRGPGAAHRASLVSWMTPASTPLVVLTATALVLAPEAFIAGSARTLAFGAGAVAAWAALVALIFWMVLHTLRDRILLGCLVAGAMTATVATMAPVGADGVVLKLLAGALSATVAAVFAVGVMTHESRMDRRGRLFLSGIVLACTFLTHVAAIATDVGPFLSATLLVTIFGLHAVAVTAMLSTLEDRLPAGAGLGILAVLVLAAAGALGLTSPREPAARTPLSSAAADVAERARDGLREKVRSLTVEPVTEIAAGDDDAVGREFAADGTRGEAFSVRSTDEFGGALADETIDEQRSATSTLQTVSTPATREADDWTPLRAAHREGDRRFDHAVMRSLCDPRADRLSEVLASWNTRPSIGRGDVIRHLRAWLACGHDALLAGENPRHIVAIARATNTEEATRLALDLARRLPEGHTASDAASSLAAQRLRRVTLMHHRDLSNRLAVAAEAVESGAAADAPALLEDLEDDIARLSLIQAWLATGNEEEARARARGFVESTTTSAWLRRRARLITEADTELSTLSAVANMERMPVAGELFTAKVVMKCDADRLVTGLGPGAARVGFRFGGEGVPSTWTFLDLVIARGETRTIVVPGRAPSEPGPHVAEMVVWRPGSEPRVLERLPDVLIQRPRR